LKAPVTYGNAGNNCEHMCNGSLFKIIWYLACY